MSQISTEIGKQIRTFRKKTQNDTGNPCGCYLQKQIYCFQV